MKTFIFSYVSSLVSLAVFDFVWLTVTIKRFYGPRLSHLTAQTTSYTPAVLFYLIYAVGVTVLVTLPAVAGNFSMTKVFLLGALFGLCAYGAYDFTNQATLKDWPVVVTVVDLLWGSFLTGLVSVISVYVTRMFS